MLDEILSLLRTSSGVHELQVVELITYGSNAFRVKIRVEFANESTLQVWLNHNERHTRYSYQLLQRGQAILRWDNAPHHRELETNYPHHFHDEREQLTTSRLRGDPIDDIKLVLVTIAHYQERR